MKKSIIGTCLWMLSVVAFAQQTTLPVPAEVQRAYAQGTRHSSGKPGPNYWQNKADYVLTTDFNPETRLLSGKADILYTNNSPDTLKQIWFKLYPNLYKKGVPVKSRIHPEDQGEGVQISAFSIDGKSFAAERLIQDGTNMHVDISALAPGRSMKLKLDYQYVLNKGSHMRTGQVNDSAHFVAYFFPRIAVYDDIDGWNKYPYTGEEEFYNDFCNFKASIRVPKGYVIWATGDLTNPAEVLQPGIAARMQQAARQDAVIDVISADDLKNKQITADRPYNTFKYEATGVPDFVFATSNHYLWKSASVVVDSTTRRRTRVDAVFNPIHQDYYEVIDFTRKTVDLMSHTFPKWPFPYAHETVFDGLDQMEYPMMVNDNPVEKRSDGIVLTVHEVFHTMFPFYMGINETKYAWMDEGWATIGEWLLSPMIDTSMVDDFGIAETAEISGSKQDVPIVTLTPELERSTTLTNNYPKPGLGYLFIRDYLGEVLFTKALHHYIQQWHGKHPAPLDFFNCMNAGAGKNLNWFWKRWFFEDGDMNLGLTDLKKTESGYVVGVSLNEGKPLPVDLTLTYEDGSVERIHRSIGIWENEYKETAIMINTTKTLKQVVLGTTMVPDNDRSDNISKL
jgi:hypothetical protein